MAPAVRNQLTVSGASLIPDGYPGSISTGVPVLWKREL